MEPFYERDGITIYVGDNRDVLPHIEPVHAVVTDPPYGLSFMGKGWDHSVPGIEFWQAISAAMLPGAHLLAFGGTRTFHRMGVAIEDAGFELRDSLLYWGYGSGFPKSHNVSKVLREKELCCTCEGSAVQYNHESLSPEGLRSLRTDVAAEEPIPEHPQQDMRPGVQQHVSESQGKGATEASEPKGHVGLSSVRSGVPGVSPNGEARQDADVLTTVQRDAAGRELETARAQGPGGVDSREPRQLPREDERTEQPGVEGRGDVLPQARELQADQVRPVPGGIHADGAQGRLRDGASAAHGEDGGLQPNALGSGASYRPRPTEQQSGQPRTVAEQSGAQAGGAWPVCDRCGLPVVPEGLGTALKPAYEPIIMARKPFKGTVAQNVLQNGTGALNVDACRIGTSGARNNGRQAGTNGIYGHIGATVPVDYGKGRWPANVILDEAAAAMLDAQSGESSSQRSVRKRAGLSVGNAVTLNRYQMNEDNTGGYDDTGGASRFFYVAKASRRERNAGLDGMPEQHIRRMSGGEYAHNSGSTNSSKNGAQSQNHHPTVKPLALMRYLIQMVTPPGGIVLDPFMGSGSTLVAAAQLGFPAIGIELSEEYAEIAARRVDHALNERDPQLALEGIA